MQVTNLQRVVPTEVSDEDGAERSCRSAQMRRRVEQQSDRSRVLVSRNAQLKTNSHTRNVLDSPESNLEDSRIWR